MNTETKLPTPVIFRKRKDEAIIAIFPTLPGTNGADSCLAYTQAEKKISYHLPEMRQTIQASMVESLDLLQEVSHAGFYPLKICHRVKGHMNKERLAAIKPVANTASPVKGGRGDVKKEETVKTTHKKRPNRWLEEAA